MRTKIAIGLHFWKAHAIEPLTVARQSTMNNDVDADVEGNVNEGDGEGDSEGDREGVREGEREGDGGGDGEGEGGGEGGGDGVNNVALRNVNVDVNLPGADGPYLRIRNEDFGRYQRVTVGCQVVVRNSNVMWWHGRVVQVDVGRQMVQVDYREHVGNRDEVLWHQIGLVESVICGPNGEEV